MKNFARNDLMFSLCGLNCALCMMKIDGYCPGCGGGAGNQGCTIARCSMEHDGVDYCYECKRYPCEKYTGITKYDSFIIHRHQLKDMEKVQSVGIETYHTELAEKSDILDYLLKNYNHGRRKTFFSLAINLLELVDIRISINNINAEVTPDMAIKEKALIAVKHLENVAQKYGIALKLKKKPPKT